MVTLLGGMCALANHFTKPISTLTAFNLGLSIPALIKVDANRRASKPKKTHVSTEKFKTAHYRILHVDAEQNLASASVGEKRGNRDFSPKSQVTLAV